MPSLIGTDVAANYLRVLPSPGAALTGVANGAPLLTFNTPNLQLFRVVVTGEDLTADPQAANSSWSKVIRAVQVTSEVFAIFAPSVNAGDSTFCFLSPDFNTNTGDASVRGSVQAAIAESGGGSGILEQAIVDAVGGSATVTRVALTGTTVA